MSVRVISGDCRAVLPTLASGSVQCCVTSPPYFGQRDYGTAQWDGGDPSCDHKQGRPGSGRADGIVDERAQRNRDGIGSMGGDCKRCGATRIDAQIGLESSLDEYVAALVEVFAEVRRVLSDTGTVWINIGDGYNAFNGNRGTESKYAGDRATFEPQFPTGHGLAVKSLKNKDLLMVPARVALALQADGWFLRSKIIWAKPNGMPGSQQDRPTSSYEEILFLTKQARYWSDFDAIKTPPRESTLVRTAQNVQAQAGSHRANRGTKTNGPMKAVGGTDKQSGHGRRHAGFNERWDAAEQTAPNAAPAMMRDVWFVSPAGYDEAHFAVMPDEIARRCILAGCPQGGTVLDPFGGAGTTGLVADRLGRDAVLIELSDPYSATARARITNDCPLFGDVA